MAASEAGGLPSVLIVTSEMVGPFKNGGIGTATTGLIETVAGMGCRTTVLYTGAIWHIEIKMKPWIERYRRIGVELVPLTLGDMRGLAGPLCEQGVGSAYLVYEFLRRRRFDIVHFNDTLGEGMYALAARHLGLDFRESRLLLGLHGPTRWAYRLNRQPMSKLFYAAFDAMERVSLRSAAAPWGPSAYLVRDLREDGLAIPVEPALRQYVMPTAHLFEADAGKFAAADAVPPPRLVHPVREIAFFGRLEQRKGLKTFCEAIDRLADRLAAAGVRVTFLGKPVLQDGGSTDDWIRARAAGWKMPWGLETGFGQPEAVAYLTRGSTVAVMPSPFDNSPCTIYEAMQYGIPFLASATGGIPELIDPEDHARVLFPYDAAGIAASLARVLDEGAVTARPRILPAERRRAWEVLNREPPAPAAVPPAAPEASFAVLVDGGEAPDGVARTLGSVGSVLGRRAVQRIVLGRGIAADGATVLDPADPATPGALARALAAAPWLLCVMAGAGLAADALPGLDRALAHPEIDGGLVPAGRERGGRRRIVPPIGGAPAFNYFEGFDYTGGAVLAAAAAAEALAAGPALKVPFLGLPDRLAAGGRELWPFPEVLFTLDAVPPPRTIPPDPERDRLFAAIPPVEAAIIRDTRAEPWGRARQSEFDRLLLALAVLPGYERLRPLLVRYLPRAIAAAQRMRNYSARGYYKVRRVLGRFLPMRIVRGVWRCVRRWSSGARAG